MLNIIYSVILLWGKYQIDYASFILNLMDSVFYVRIIILAIIVTITIVALTESEKKEL
jgi:hypothetical protein